MPEFFFLSLTLFGILISGSRSAFFFILAGLAVFLLNKNVRLRYRVLVIGAMILLLIVAGGTLTRRLGKMGKHANEILSGSDTLGALNNLTNGRIAMLRRWSTALGKYPLAGVGTGNFLFYYRFQNFGRIVYEDLPLNQYLHVAVETGFIGLLAFVFFLASLWWRQRRKADKIILAAILIILFVNTAVLASRMYPLVFLFNRRRRGDPPSGSRRL